MFIRKIFKNKKQDTDEDTKSVLWRRLKITILTLLIIWSLGVAAMTYCVWANIRWLEGHPEYEYKKALGIRGLEMKIHDRICQFYKDKYCAFSGNYNRKERRLGDDENCQKILAKHCYWQMQR